MNQTIKKSLLSASVGGGDSKNLPDDVSKVQYIFNILSPLKSKSTPESGICTASLVTQIRQFQHSVSGVPHPDGRIDPIGPTLRHLTAKALAVRGTRKDLGPFPPTSVKTMRASVDAYLYAAASDLAKPPTRRNKAASTSGVSNSGLTDKDFSDAASALDPKISPALVHAFADVESGGRSGFGPAGLPVIAYEGHIFRALTSVRSAKTHPHITYPYDKTYPLLSYRYKKKAGPEWQKNNKDQATAWVTLNTAMALNHDAAIESCSWGMFQVLGRYYTNYGYGNVDDFVTGMKTAKGQLNSFIGYCRTRPGMVQAMIAKNFATMASLYNGADYGDYDQRIQKAYKSRGGT